MGNRNCISSRRAAKEEQRRGSQGSIVPDHDPLLRVVSQRIVRAEITRDFTFTSQVLGTGYSGAVRLAVNKVTGKQVAVKSFQLRRLKPHQLKLLKGEVEVYLHLDHPNICRLLHAYEGKHDVWLVMELCDSELYAHLCRRKTYNEGDAAEIMRQMLQAVNYLHSNRIVHRDLKLENWMYGTAGPNEPDDRLRLIDFGFSRMLEENEFLDMPCGTLHYTSPEVLNRKYTGKCDMWSLGVICYMLLVGRPPFRGSNNLKIAKAIVRCEYCKDHRWHSLTSSARDFVQKLLQVDPTARLDAAAALNHRWVNGMGSSNLTPRGEIGVRVLSSIRKFAQSSHLRRAALTALAYTLTSQDLKELEETFMALDASSSGTITLDELRGALEQFNIPRPEVERMFKSFDISGEDVNEVRYTPFVAAMLATRVRLHEDKVRTAFEAFDKKGAGYITVDGLLELSAEKGVQGSQGALTREEAEQWIREADYKGNGVIDYDEFLATLHGKTLWAPASLDEDDQTPIVRVFHDDGRVRGQSESDVLNFKTANSNRSAISRRRGSRFSSALSESILCAPSLSQSFSEECEAKRILHLRSLQLDLDERYFG
eukprot:TRINITY_DN30868_c0_g1_i1.p1 TRINITY_DN30868_c0_g1~~TRINITY_DN30868_c0_g1_i1.p1  ORF type:complete len:597 (-),score=119.19 TRINITY_DN30868_c0_g1_i1:259-2049(-)